MSIFASIFSRLTTAIPSVKGMDLRSGGHLRRGSARERGLPWARSEHRLHARPRRPQVLVHHRDGVTRLVVERSARGVSLPAAVG
jgi:hypothetical protein